MRKPLKYTCLTWLFIIIGHLWFEWYAVWCGFHNKCQKHTCLKRISLRDQNMTTTLGSIVIMIDGENNHLRIVYLKDRFTRGPSPTSQVTRGQSVQSQPLRAWSRDLPHRKSKALSPNYDMDAYMRTHFESKELRPMLRVGLSKKLKPTNFLHNITKIVF